MSWQEGAFYEVFHVAGVRFLVPLPSFATYFSSLFLMHRACEESITHPSGETFSDNTCRRWMTTEEQDALVETCASLDPNRVGRIPVTSIGRVLEAVDEEV